MATKKKAAKPAKKAVAPKKAAPAKKPAAKPAAVKKPIAKPAPKKAAKPAPAKAAAAKKPATAPAKTAVAKKPAAKPAPAPVKAVAKPEAKKAVAAAPVKTAVKAPEVKKAVEVKPEVKKPEVKEVKKPEPVAPPPIPKKTPAPPPKPVKVVIPELKTKSVRKYEPDFTKSVLDQPENIQTGPTMRYSDSELQEFKDLILKKLEQAKKELTYLQGLITRKDEMGGDENENRYMTMEDGSMSMEREQLAQMASRQINYIDHLEKALMRIENKTYGICRVTGKLIDKARLRAVPHATLSIEAKQMMNK
ncbi:TraR/DksA family transcriptional regulator [Pseudoflavitalea sp. G-6-1-2]|uniref:TraR/DksA family transcriptional regulator n=1 Tax=Pseudoflavitalea sp. G-6-1-2 TaxID=2728841 RepID=UPI00146F7A95|nr:TraR/DksA C4-type zinc finger protein [Pseudoflavitalea sp. G-6-1-2]NML20425.1 TraR/DksA family transcriptional regulator [Pseudoflavitalea sp. G-6-1-2]